MDKKRRNEIILVIGILLMALLSFALVRYKAAGSSTKIEVSVESQVFASYSIDQEVDEVITGHDGGTNHLIIKNGNVTITEASCPDKVCVRQGNIKESGQTLVCLPNKVIVTIK